MTDASQVIFSERTLIASLEDVLSSATPKKVYIANNGTGYTAVSLIGDNQPVDPSPVELVSNVNTLLDNPKWYLKGVPGQHLVCTIQNAASGLYANADEDPSEGAIVFEGKPRAWKIILDVPEVRHGVRITPTGPQEDVLFWVEDPNSDPSAETDPTPVTLRTNNGSTNTVWRLFYAP